MSIDRLPESLLISERNWLLCFYVYGVSRKLLETKYHFAAPAIVEFPAHHNKRGFLSGM